jgi:hypothetical protein
MKESYGLGLATHAGPESCGDVREGKAEALTGVFAGQVLSREIDAPAPAAIVALGHLGIGQRGIAGHEKAASGKPWQTPGVIAHVAAG